MTRTITQGDKRSLRRIIRKHIVRSDRDFGMLRTEYIERVEVDDMAADLVEWADRRALRTASAPAPSVVPEAAPSATRDEVARAVRSVTDHWDEPLDEVHDVPPIADTLLARFTITPQTPTTRR